MSARSEIAGTESQALARSVLIGLFVLFFSSGALALIYEVVWQRQFALVFGSAAPATAAVLAAYFAGLGLGSRVVGAAAAKWKRPLRIYAVLEVLIGAGAVMVTPLLHGFERVYPWLFEQFAASPGIFVFAKMLFAFMSIGIPTFCMGGTLPVLGQFVDRGQRRLGISAGLLYVANTLGAALGALSVPFLFLPMLGAKGTLWFCVTGNLLVALAAWRLDGVAPASRGCVRDPSGQTGKDEAREEPAKPREVRLASFAKRPVLVLALLSGFVTFVLQVLWNRAFAQVHENSMYSFAVIAAVFVLALAVGAQFARIALRRMIAPERLIGWSWLASGVLVALTPWAFLQLTNGLAYVPSQGGWSHYAGRLVMLTVSMLFVPVSLLGVALPVLMDEAGQRSTASPGKLLGQLMAVNVLGSVAGAIVAGFLLPRITGLWESTLLCAAVLVLAGGWQFDSRPTKGLFEKSRLESRLQAVGAWDRPKAGLQTLRTHSHRSFQAGSKGTKALFRLGLVGAVILSFCLLGRIEWPRVRISPQGERLVAVSEGTHGIIAVVERADARRLKLNNHYVLGGTASTGDERMQTHLPLLLHPSPQRVAILGLGTGITASGALFHPVTNITAVELVPEVVAAAREHFRRENSRVIEDPRTRMIIDDARNFLRGTGQKFDVIVGDLVVPWRQGEGALFTLEHFEAARQALAPGGLFCQWLPSYQFSEPEFRIVVRTFLSVFPSASIWRGDFLATESAVALVGGVDHFEIKPAEVARRIRELQPDPSNTQLSEPLGFWMYFVGILEPGDLSPNEMRINREDRPWIELIGPLRHAGQQKASLWTGRRLQGWLNELKQRTSVRITTLGTAEARGCDAGELLFEYSLSLAERNEPKAGEAQARLRSLLPADTYRALFPEGRSGSAR